VYSAKIAVFSSLTVNLRLFLTVLNAATTAFVSGAGIPLILLRGNLAAVFHLFFLPKHELTRSPKQATSGRSDDASTTDGRARGRRPSAIEAAEVLVGAAAGLRDAKHRRRRRRVPHT
jgi:hypothetical protein